MTDQTRYRVSGPDIVFEEFDGDLVVLNLASGQYFGFSAEASLVWAALLDGHSPAVIAPLLHKDAGPISPFVKTLIGHQLLVPDTTAAAPPTMDAGKAAKLSEVRTPPVARMYDDLSDLIVSDPIHEADEEAGWPVMR